MKKKEQPEKRFAEIVTKDEDAKTNGFFWCGGASWRTMDYRCVLLAVPHGSGGYRRCAAIELHAETPEGLAQEMAAHAMEPLPPSEIRRLCESAGRSPRPPRKPAPQAPPSIPKATE